MSTVPATVPAPAAQENKALSTLPSLAFWIDEPTDWSEKVRRLRISGWCIAREGLPLTQIRARIQDHIFPGAFDRERADAVAYVGLPDAPLSCGFTLNVRLPCGRSELLVEVAAEMGPWIQVLRRAVYGARRESAAEHRRWADLRLADAQRRYVSWFDLPRDWTQPTRTLSIAGWCVDSRGGDIKAIRARLGRHTFVGTFGLPRADVAALFPHLPPLSRAVFALLVDVPNRDMELSLELRTETGEWVPFCRRPISGHADRVCSTSKLPAELHTATQVRERSRFEFWLDRPGDWNKRRRYLYVSGWCFAAAGEPVREVRARIAGREFPGKYGIPRPDVSARLNGLSGTLPSGFTIEATVPWGRRSLVLEAQRPDGGWEPFYRRHINGISTWKRLDDSTEAVGNYAAWIRAFDTLTWRDRRQIRHHIARFACRRMFSILLPVYNTDAHHLARAIRSVRRQLYPHWELCVVDDASTAPHVRSILERLALRDRRIKLHRRETNGQIAAASNDALKLATGEFVALLDHDDELASTALYFAAVTLERRPEVRLLYSDEDKLDGDGRRCDPHFKSDWNPDLLTSQNYISHLGFYEANLVRLAGGFRSEFEGAQDYDLTLRCIEEIKPEQIAHIPHVLYHWRRSPGSTAQAAAAKPHAEAAAVHAVQNHLNRVGDVARAESDAGYVRVRYSVPSEAPLVSVIIPTRDRADDLRRCVESIFTKTDYVRYEIVVIDNETREPAALAILDQLRRNERVQTLRIEGEFNYSRLNNLGVAQSRGEFIVLLNNDTEVLTPGWLSEMVSHGLRSEIGVVGALLRYPDGTLQHAGVILGVDGGVASHAFTGSSGKESGFSRARLVQNFSAVTGACMLMRKETYLREGGLDEKNLAVAYNDIDFCLRVQKNGLRIVWSPYAELQHHESASRGPEDTLAKLQRFQREALYMFNTWGERLKSDPFYNPNLSIDKALFTVAFPPRTEKPWKAK